MADPLTADTIVAALRAEGVKVVEHPGWRTNNRNHKGPWGPVNGVIIHHTVTSGTASTVELCFNGHADLPGPLCHGVIAKDGTVYLVGNGRANHAGGGDPAVLTAVVNESYGDRPPAPTKHEGSKDAADGNARFYGFECVNLGDGNDPWPAAQLDAIERVSAAICRAHGWGAKSVIGHLEWSDWKVDPRGFSMVSMRSRIAARLAGTTPTPTPTPPKETGMQLSDKVNLTWTDGEGKKHLLWAGQLINGRSEISVDYALANAAASVFLGDQVKKRVEGLAAQVAALTAVVTTLAEGGGLTAAEIQAAAEAGAQAALDRLGDALQEG